MKANVFANISGQLGYNRHAQGMIEGLIQNGVDVTAVPMEHQMVSQLSNPVISAIKKKLNYESPSVCLNYGNNMHHFWGKKRIGYTVWETTKIPEDWVTGLNALDEVWTVSQFCKKSFEDSGVDKDVKVVHEGVDTTVFSKYVEPKQPKQDDHFLFLTVGKWEKRKGYDVLLKAFCKEFKEDENVALAMQCANPFVPSFNPWQELFMANMGSHAPIIVVPPVKDAPELAKIYRSADCFVLPTRGESWGLPLLESMACGVPVITTNWGGSLEFVNNDVGWLIDVEKMELPNDGPFFKPLAGNEWALPSEKHLQELMRYAFEHKDECKKKGDKAYEVADEKYTWLESMKTAKELLSQ